MQTAFLELENGPRESLRCLNAGRLGTIRAVQPFDRLSLGRAGKSLQAAI
jgi:hypothetical protein